MALRIEANAEPIPGYRLIERLGSGGFGEVWKAEAPGGLFKAIKFVQRVASEQNDSAISSFEERSRADQEWKSLLRVKAVRHPFILLLDRFENIDDYLVIVMELADRTLGDRFKESRGQGLPGIPRDELLGYLLEAAEVLDLMNAQYQLQHLDIKPQNLFLVHNHVKVADFGLVKDTAAGGNLMTITGGVTPVYAAPETFDGKFSRQSDQYSLAIVYQEMLTGRRPFAGTSLKQLILQHLQNAYDLNPAPAHDRAVLTRALAKNPEDRFPTCTEFVQELRRAGVGQTAAVPVVGTPMDAAAESTTRTIGIRGASALLKRSPVNLAEEIQGKQAVSAEKLFVAQDSGASVSDTARVRQPPVKPDTVHPELSGIVQPALIVGLGQIGIETLIEMRNRIAGELGAVDALHNVRFLAIDTDSSTLQTAQAGSTAMSFRQQDTLQTRLQRPSHYLKTRDGKLPTDHWLDPRLIYRIPREQCGSGVRALGRLALVDNQRILAKRLEGELLSCCSHDTPHQSAPACDLGLRTHRPRVYIVTSLTGNTGSGMFIDVAYLTRRLLNNHGHRDAEIVGVFFLPAARPESGGTALANAYSALLELQHYSQQDSYFEARYETAASLSKGEEVSTVGMAFQRGILFQLPPIVGKPSADTNKPVTACAGDFLYRDVATPLGPAMDAARRAANDAMGGTVLQSVGFFNIHWPRQQLLEQSARWLCNQIVARWMSKDASTMRDTIYQWNNERWDEMNMRPEQLIERFQQLAGHSLQKTPEHILADILGPLQKSLSDPATVAKGKAGLNFAEVSTCKEAIDCMIGCPDEGRTRPTTEPSVIERTLGDIAHVIADECEQRLAELAVTLLEDPNYRLAGAEEALRQFCTIVEKALQSQEILAKDLGDKASQLSQRIHHLIDPNSANSARHTMMASVNGHDVFELVRTYAKTRYHSLMLTYLNRLYVALRGHLSDQIREVGFCRQRLTELAGYFQPGVSPPKAAPLRTDGRILFPADCPSLHEAVDRLTREISHQDQLEFDSRVQRWITANCDALLQICMGSSNQVRNLAPIMLQNAQTFLKERLHGASVADMYLAQQRSRYSGNTDELIMDDLERCLDEATPTVGRLSNSRDVPLVTLPNDAFGEELQAMATHRGLAATIRLSNRSDEIVFFQQATGIQWHELEQLGPIARDAYMQRGQTDPAALHSRNDIIGSLAAAGHK
jgi:serine/threonine protein kinase